MTDNAAILKAAEDALEAAQKARDAAGIVEKLKPGLLSRLNTFVTVVAAIATTLIGLRMKEGELRLQKIAEINERIEAGRALLIVVHSGLQKQDYKQWADTIAELLQRADRAQKRVSKA